MRLSTQCSYTSFNSLKTHYLICVWFPADFDKSHQSRGLSVLVLHIFLFTLRLLMQPLELEVLHYSWGQMALWLIGTSPSWRYGRPDRPITSIYWSVLKTVTKPSIRNWSIQPTIARFTCHKFPNSSYYGVFPLFSEQNLLILQNKVYPKDQYLDPLSWAKLLILCISLRSDHFSISSHPTKWQSNRGGTEVLL